MGHSDAAPDQPRRLNDGGRINRARVLEFSFNGQRYQGYDGDTLASALLANDVRVVARSFKYHRVRGIIGSGAEEPNAIFQIGSGPGALPNLRATQTELYYGLEARSVNCWPSLAFDVGAINSLGGRMLPAGFYYKTFMWPRRLWLTYEHFIRKAAGLGSVPTGPDPDSYDKLYAHCDVLVVGGGPAGLAAALAAGRTGARVILADEQRELGGSLLGSKDLIDAAPAMRWVEETLARLGTLDNVRLLARSTVFGYYDHNFLGILQRRGDHLPPATSETARQRVWHVRAKQVVLATGAIERPLVFGNNDRPGVMLASAVSSYVNRFAVAPGSRAIVFTNNDSAYATAHDLLDAGVGVRALVDARSSPPLTLCERLRERGVQTIAGHVVSNVNGRGGVESVDVLELSRDGHAVVGAAKKLSADLVAVSGGWSPVVHLHSQSGGKPRFDTAAACFVPGNSVQAERSAGACNAGFELHECLSEGLSQGAAAAQAAGFGDGRPPPPPAVADMVATDMRAVWVVPGPRPIGRGPKQFVDFQNDTTAADIVLAAREGFRSIEHVKRYTALGFGTDQGKLGNVNGAAILAGTLGNSIADTGTTTFRPAYTPCTFGAIAGRDIGVLFDPERETAVHGWHVEHGAEFENVGQWKRPWYYPGPGEDIHAAVNRECLATRNSVGILDASTLGKIDIVGPDAGEFLDRMYTNGWKKLPVGRCRYGLMLGEDGMVMDDGVTTRLDDYHYHMTTTTGGAANVMSWLERWLQTEWPELRVLLTSVTDHWATISVAGPNSRNVVMALCTDIDFSEEAFPFMSYRQGTVAGVEARVFRISFSGELAYEINVSANYGRCVWEAFMAAGKAYGITPYGTEAMHVLRAEKGYVIVGQDTDGSMTPQDLGMDWICAKHKDFLGKRSLSRIDSMREDRKQLVGLLTERPTDVLPEGAQLSDKPRSPTPVPMVGHVSSSYFSACLGHSIALALVKGGRDRMGETLHAPLADGRVLKVTLSNPVFYDADGDRQTALGEMHGPDGADDHSPPRVESALARCADLLSGPTLTVGERAFLGHINLRGDPSDRTFIDAVRRAAGVDLPMDPNTVSEGESCSALWLCPDEWLLLTPAGPSAELASELSNALAKHVAAVNRLDGGQTVIRIAGPSAREVLAKGCPLDLDQRVFSPGQCAQTRIAKTGALIWLIDGEPTFDIVVRRSFASYLWRWLDDATREYRI
jgi:sarcosine oxidase subunit alpha